ncbi:uncharacterized protein TNIN_176861 [Trichonephila inaurata madagascariensis]|uniref:Uncharacterized protein n=1 Tax=Trichonephila inaurata madagascariensis TaxID=2747483 RepID=A0A8X6Y3P6_9ARAC|nr:uncharacterized protein TNIN_176861 [Trichonephila inaurata madagascariensis]
MTKQKRKLPEILVSNTDENFQILIYAMQHITNPWQNNCVSGNISPSPVAINSFNPNVMSYGGLPPPEVAPASTAVYATTSTFSWAHTVPSFMPWVTRGEANVQDPIVHFTAPFPPDPCTSQTATSWELLNNFYANKGSINSHLKRKSDLEVIEAAPQKVCATEERMAARFREMHISNQFTVPSETVCGSPECNSTEKREITNLNQLDFILKSSEGDPSKSLVLAPELKKLVEPEKIFASTFLSKVERRPSLALVPWTPNNNNLLRPSANLQEGETQEKEDSSLDRNTILPLAQLSAACSQISSNFASKDSNSTIALDVEMDT